MTTAQRDRAIDPRLRARRRAVAADRRRRRRRALVGGVAVALVVAGLVGLARSPWLAVERIAVEGARGDRALQVHDRAAIVVGEPLATVDGAGVAADVRALAWVRDAEVRRRPPSTLLVAVTPREPIAVVAAADGTWLVDDDLVVVGGGSAEGLPTVQAGEAGVAPVGEPVRAETLREALAVVEGLPPGLVDRISSVEAPRPRGVVAHLEDPEVRVELGAPTRLPEKGEVLELLLEDLADDDELDHVETIDLRMPDNPTVRHADP